MAGPGPAAATGSTADGYDTAYAGPGSQYANWSATSYKERLKVSPASSMSVGRCMDAMIDWNTGGSGHFDSRLVRSCKPGTSEETDPGGNGFWQESSYDFTILREIHSIWRGYGYVIDLNRAVLGTPEAFSPCCTETLSWANGYAPVPGVGFSRIRVRYYNGSVGSCNPLPTTSATFQGCS